LRLALAFVETIGDDGGGRFIDDMEDIRASDNASILGCLTLNVIEICWVISIYSMEFAEGATYRLGR